MPNPIKGFFQDLARNNFSIKTTLRDTVLRDPGLIANKEWFSGYSSHAGVAVTESSSMRVAAVFACVNCISWDLASLPVITYERLDRGKKRAPNHPVYHLLHDEPNSEQTAFQFISSRQTNALLSGNGYAEIEFQAGKPAALWPIPSWRCQPMRTNNEARELFYRITLPDNTQKDLAPYRILHLPGLSMDGIIGMSVIRQGRESIGLALAQEEFGARFYGNGTNIGMVATHPSTLSAQASANLKTSIANQSEGLGKSHRIMLLEDGLKVEKMTIQPDDAQYIEGRQFQIEDIARMFRVPPHKIGHLLRATFSNIEQQNTEYYISTLRPWIINWEQEIKRKLFTPWDGDRYFSAFLFDSLLRGDTLARYSAYNLGRNAGFLSANEIREMENLNPIEGGDEYLRPLNMVNVGDDGTDASTPDDTSTDNLKQQVLQYVLENIADREAQNLTRAVKKYAGDPTAFRRWADDYYRDIGEFIREQFAHAKMPVPQGFVERYTADSRAEINNGRDLAQIAASWKDMRLSIALSREIEFLKK
jgi:HK97 family phage portal protein